jgi:hypothetical protein
MAATYSTALSTAKDRIRFRIGDIDVATAALLSDEEIAAVLSLKSSDEDAACLMLAKHLLAKHGREVVKITQDGQTLDFSERIPVWRELVADLEQQSSGGLRVRRIARPQSITSVSEYTS